MKIKLGLPDGIGSGIEGFQKLINFAENAKQHQFASLEIDLSGVRWLDANMCSPLGAILYKISRKPNAVSLAGLSQKLEKILSKNGFLAAYGREKIPDTYGTTIEYKRFEPADERYFASYVETHLKGKGIPPMSAALRKKFRESIFEIFSNAVIHSQTKFGIFSCGQFFPVKNRLDFSLTDLGVGIRENLKQMAGLDLPAAEAIQWAMEGKNTTKKGAIPGGLGLKVLREFITMNKGRMQIVSDGGYWELNAGAVNTQSFSVPFPGTTVNIEINTADAASYCLASELSPADIF
ncbi:MAG TPA: ATP-binding protein [Elusimicrobiota bacterium]|nr:ATP-binding protein [Elusimicrobiota bacterium]